jgi:cytosol aminopeptidase family protein
MPGLTVKVIFQDITKVESEAIVVGFFEDVRPLKGLAGQLDWLLCGALSNLLLLNKLRGSQGEMALLTARGKIPAQKIFMVGLGPWSGFSLPALKNAARTVAASVVGAGAETAAVEYIQPPQTPHDAGIPAFKAGLAAGAGGRSLAVSLLAPDKAVYEELSRLVKEY